MALKLAKTALMVIRQSLGQVSQRAFSRRRDQSVYHLSGPLKDLKPAKRTLRTRARFAYALLILLPACGTPANLIGIEGDPPVSQVLAEGDEVRIYIATTRSPSDEEGVFFSGERSPTLNFASVDVFIPPSHQAGQVELAKRPPPDPRKHFVLRSPTVFPDSRAFQAGVGSELQTKSGDARTTLIFIHGYNTNMTEAVARFAQLIHDTGYEGVPILFSWPSARRVLDYVTDINSAAYSRDALAETAVLVNRLPFKSVDVLAHSMGNFLMMETARSMSLRGDFNRLNRLGNVILASPDIDIDLFEAQLSTIPPAEREKFVILVSQNDRALTVASRVAGGKPRVGAADPALLTETGVNVVDLTAIDDESSIHHSKFADSPAIVKTLGARLADADTLSTETTAAGVAIQRVGGVFEIVQLQ